MKLTPDAKLPTRATAGSAGYDLYADSPEAIYIEPGKTCMIHTGIALAIPKGFAGFIFARSGIAIKNGITPANCVGVIDSDYRGEIIVGLYNHSSESFTVNSGDRIAQLVLLSVSTPPLDECKTLDMTERGKNGFGSTGK